MRPRAPVRLQAHDRCTASVLTQPASRCGLVRVQGLLTAEAWRPRKSGRLRKLWDDHAHNLIVNAGLDYLLQTGSLLGSAWYLGLLSSVPAVAATDTMAAHAGWAEVQAYTQATRVQWIGARLSVGVADNSASPASYSINANGTVVGGVFGTSVNTKGGATGTLLSGVPFSGGDRLLQSGDTLLLKYQYALADDGI